MDVNIFLAFVIATTIMIAMPGPSVLLTVAHSISFGEKRALTTVAGETVGVAVQLLIAAAGLTTLLNVVAEAFNWLRLAGAAYLTYLGIKQWQSANKPLEFDATSTSNKNLFMQGLVVTIPNPKSLIFIAAFLPQFIDASRPLDIQFALIVPTFLIITFVVTSAWALAAGKSSRFFQSQRAFQSFLRASGGLMIIAGMGLALAYRGN